MVADTAGAEAIDALTMTALQNLGYVTPFETGPMVGLLPQPKKPRFRLLLVECDDQAEASSQVSTSRTSR